ncbi:MAG: hypothetical protein ACFE95_07615 [Candidatus Hodarchaeota archaeon]
MLELFLAVLAIFLAIYFYFKTNEILNKIDDNVNQIVEALSTKEKKKIEIFETFKASNIEVEREPKIGLTRPDFIIKKDTKKIPVEVKNYPKRVISNELIDKLRKQMYEYMTAAKSDIAYLIIFAPEVTDIAYEKLGKEFYDGKKIQVIRIHKGFSKISDIEINITDDGKFILKYDES